MRRTVPLLLLLVVVALVAPASQAHSVDGAGSTAEPRQATSCPEDRDCDGTPDASDFCPSEQGTAYRGCPKPPFIRAYEANGFVVSSKTLRVGRRNNDLSVGCFLDFNPSTDDGSYLPGCDVDLTVKVSVSAATRAKYGLASATIIKATLKKTFGVSGSSLLRLASSQAVRNKLKSARSLPVTVTMTVRSPVVETVTEKFTIYNEAFPTTKGKYFFLRTSGDTPDGGTEQGDGGRGR